MQAHDNMVPRINDVDAYDDEIIVVSTIGQGPAGPEGRPATQAQVYQASSDFIEAHPEYVTTVMDGAITPEKLNELTKRNLVRSFDTVAQMQAAADLVAGMTCHTNGFHSVGDGGAAFYVISASGTANGMDVLALQEGLYATLVITEPYVTPEQFGAYGDGTHDDTAAIVNAIASGRNVNGGSSYLTSETIALNSSRTNPTEFRFNTIVYTGAANAIKVTGYNGILNVQRMTCANGSGIVIGDDVATWMWNIHTNEINAPNGFCVKFDSVPNEGISQITLSGEMYVYGTNAIILDTSSYWVGQNVIKDIRFIANNASAGYAITADCSTYPVTGLTVNNLSFEGAHGGFEILNTEGNRAFESLYGFSLRTAELTHQGYKIMKLTGAGLLKGALHIDQCADLRSAFDLSEYTLGMISTGLFRVYGRLIGNGLSFNELVFVRDKVAPVLVEQRFDTFSTDKTFSDSQYPPTFVSQTAGTYTFNFSEPVSGWFSVLAAAGTTVVIDNRTFTITETTLIEFTRYRFAIVIKRTPISASIG